MKPSTVNHKMVVCVDCDRQSLIKLFAIKMFYAKPTRWKIILGHGFLWTLSCVPSFSSLPSHNHSVFRARFRLALRYVHNDFLFFSAYAVNLLPQRIII